MRILVFSDLHAHAFRPYSEVLPNGRNSRLQDILDILEQIYLACKVLSVDGVVFGGDLFHARSVISVATFNDVYEAIAKIKNIVKFFVMLVGNHDQSNKLGTIHSTKTFNAVVDVIDKPRWYTGVTETEAINILALPFTDYKDDLVGMIEEQTTKPVLESLEPGRRMMLGHFGVSGAEPGANFVLVSPDLITLPQLKPNLFDEIFLGHYHKSQELLNNARYIGATHQHNWGDAEQIRGVWIWDTDRTGKYSIASQLQLKAPKFVRVRTDQPAPLPTDLANNFLRIVFTSHRTRQEWESVKKLALEDWQARWAEEWVEIEASSSVEAVGAYTPNMDIEDMIDPFVDDADTQLDKDVLKELGHTFIRDCR